MKKRILITLFAAMLVLAMAGCGKKEKTESASQNTVSDTDAGSAQTETTDQGSGTVTEQPQSTEASESTEAAENAEAKEVSAAAIGSELREKIAYKDELSEIDTETLKMYIYLDDVTVNDAKIYESTGATAEEIVVLECASNDDAKKAQAAFEQRIEEQKESYEDYVPEELVKLSKPVIITKDNYAILSVSDEPDKAKEIIDAFF